MTTNGSGDDDVRHEVSPPLTAKVLKYMADSLV